MREITKVLFQFFAKLSDSELHDLEIYTVTGDVLFLEPDQNQTKTWHEDSLCRFSRVCSAKYGRD